MTTRKCESLIHSVWVLLCIAWLTQYGFHTQAATQDTGAKKELLVQLVWGTDQPKPAQKDFKKLDEKVAKKIRAFLRWKDYYEVSRQTLTFPADHGRKKRVSDQCEIIVKEVKGDSIEVMLIGEKLPNNKSTYKLRPIFEKGEHIAIGGGVKENQQDAWLIVISAAKKKKDTKAAKD